VGVAHPSPALALHARAQDHANRGELPVAEELLLEALAMSADIAELSLIDGTLAFVEAEQGKVGAAFERCRSALERQNLPTESRALLVGQFGWVTWLSGDTPRAIERFTEAIDNLDDEHRVRMLIDRGIAYLTLGELDGARLDFTAGLAATDPLNAAKCAHNLGYVHLLRGELVDAIRRMDTARPILDALGPWVTASIDIDRAEALEAAGLDREAVGLLRQVRQRLADTDLWRMQADVEVRLARLLSGAEAIELAEAAVERYAAHGNEVEADQARAVALHRRVHDSAPPAPEELEAVATRLRDAGRAESARRLRIRAAGLRGELPETVPDTAPLTTRLLAGEVAAEVALRDGSAALALARAAAAIDDLEDWQQTIGSLELQTATRSLGVRVLRLGQRAALATADPAALLEWSERARELVARGVPVRPPEELGDLLARLRHLGPEGDPDERARLVEAVRRGRWHAPGSVRPVGTLDLATLQAALGDARFVSVLQIDDQVVALVVEADDVRVLRLGPWDRLAARLGGLGADLAVAAQSPLTVVRAGLQERLAAVDELLCPAWAGASHVVLTVHGDLDRVPWGQLASLRGVAVTLPTSATAWVRSAAAASTPPTAPAVVLGPGTDTGVAEADAVRRSWAPSAEAAVHDAATCTEVAGLAATADLLHVSAHGHDRDAHPLLASVDLADGPWFGHDVELLPRVPAVVVLSACGVGGGSLGMARAWLHAGARRVIASPADISEAAAAERFPRLHALLAAGTAPERAVAEAFGPDALDCTVQCYGPA
jgi:tetratricopeptide (TPR) repeat protein